MRNNSKQKILLYIFWGGIALLLFLGIALYLDLHKKNSLSETVIVRVNNVEMTASELSEKLVRVLESYDLVMAKDPQVVAFTKGKIIDEFINDTLLLAWAGRNNISVSSKEIEEEVNKVRAFYPDDISFKEALAQSRQSFKEWEDKITKKLLQKKVFDFLASKTEAPSENDMRSYYNANRDEFKKRPAIRIRQILVDSEDTANRIYSGMNNQSNFAELAKKFSMGPEADVGGDIGWVEQGTLEIFDRGFNMRMGQRSPVLKSAYGYHIFEVLDKRGEQILSYENARENIRRILLANKEQAIYSAWLEEQIRSSKIFKNQEIIDSIHVRALGESQ